MSRAAAMPDEAAFARLRARVLLPAIVVVTALVVGALTLAVRAAGHRPAVDERVVGLVAYIATSLAIAWQARRAGVDWRRLFGAAPTREMLPLVSVVVPVGLFTLAAAILVFVPISYVAPGFVQREILAGETLTSPRSIPQWLALMVVGVVAAPFVEEVLFRGLLLHRWAHRWGTTTGVVASATLFAMLHQEWLGHWVFGVALALLYLRTRTLWVPILAHALNNFVALLGTLPGAITHRPEPVQTLAEFRADVVWIAPLLAAALVTGWLWVRTFLPGGVRATLRSTLPYDRIVDG